MLAPAGDVYQAGTLSGNPLAVAAGLATLELLDEPAYLRLAAITERLADGPARGRRRAPRAGRRALPGLLTVFFSERPVSSTSRTPARATCEAHGAWCRELLSRGRLPAAVAVRGVVPLAGPHRRAARAHARGRRGGLRGAARRRGAAADERTCSSAWRALLRERGRADGRRSCLPADGTGRQRRRASRAEPGPARRRRPARGGQARGVRAARRGDLRGLPAALRRRRGWCAPPRPTSGCWPATSCMRSGSRGWSRSATPRPWPSWPTRSRSARSRTAPASEALADAVWDAGARAVGWGSSDAHRRAKELGLRGRRRRRSRRCAQAPRGCRRRA